MCNTDLELTFVKKKYSDNFCLEHFWREVTKISMSKFLIILLRNPTFVLIRVQSSNLKNKFKEATV